MSLAVDWGLAAGVALCFAWSRLVLVETRPLGYDSYGHQYMINEVRRQGISGVFQLRTRLVSPLSATNPEPLAWHWVVSKMTSVPLSPVHAELLNISVEALALLTSGTWLVLAGVPVEVVLIALILYLSTPLLALREQNWPRLDGVSPRMSAEAVATLTTTCVVFPLGIAVVDAGALIVGTFALLLISKFSRQYLLLVLAPVAVATDGPIQLLPILTGLAMAALLSGRWLWSSMVSQFTHLYWYATKGRQDWNASQQKVGLGRLNRLLRTLASSGVLKVAVLAPVVPLAFSVGMLFFSLGIDPRGESYFGVLLLLGIVGILLVLVSTSRFRFLGESERYAFPSVLPAAVLIGSLTTESGAVAVLGVLLVALGLLSLLPLYGLRFQDSSGIARRLGHLLPGLKSRRTTRLDTEIRDAATCAALRAISAQAVLLVPFSVGGGPFRLLCESPTAQVLYPFGGGATHQKWFEETIGSEYPELGESSIKRVMKSGIVDAVAIDSNSRFHKSIQGDLSQNCLEGWAVAFENDDVLILSRHSGIDSAGDG